MREWMHLFSQWWRMANQVPQIGQFYRCVPTHTFRTYFNLILLMCCNNATTITPYNLGVFLPTEPGQHRPRSRRNATMGKKRHFHMSVTLSLCLGLPHEIPVTSPLTVKTPQHRNISIRTVRHFFSLNSPLTIL